MIPEEGRAKVFWMDGPQNIYSAFAGKTLFHSTLTKAARINHPFDYHCSPGYNQAILDLGPRKLTESSTCSLLW